MSMHRIQLDEMNKMMKDPLYRKKLEQASRTFFHKADRDGGGTISPMEFAKTLKQAGKSYKKKGATRENHKRGKSWFDSPFSIYQKIDVDGDGDIDEQEFIDYVLSSRCADPEFFRNLLLENDPATASVANPAPPALEPLPEFMAPTPPTVEKNDDLASAMADLMVAEKLNEKAADRILNLQKQLNEYTDVDEEVAALNSQITEMKNLLNAKTKEVPPKRPEVDLQKINDAHERDRNDRDEMIQRLHQENIAIQNQMDQLKQQQQLQQQQQLEQQQQQQQQQLQLLQEQQKAVQHQAPTMQNMKQARGSKHNEEKHNKSPTMSLASSEQAVEFFSSSTLWERQRRVVAMLSVMKDQAESLRADIETAREALSLDPESESKRIMVNQYMKRFATEMKQVNQLEMELRQLKKQIKKHGGNASIANRHDRGTNLTRKRTGPVARNFTESKVTRSPRYRNPNQFHIKGKQAEKAGMMYSNWNRAKRCQWQVKKESPSPLSYRPNYQTCQDTYDYNWDNDPKAKARKNKQVSLLNARQRRGSTLEHVSLKNKEQYALALVDEGSGGSGGSSKTKRMQNQLSEVTRRASMAEKDCENQNDMWRKKYEQQTLELVQMKHRFDNITNVARSTVRAIDEFVYDTLYANDNNSRSSVTVHMNQFRSIATPAHGLRMLIGVTEPHHIQSLLKSNQYHHRHVANRGFRDTQSGDSRHQYMFAEPGSSMNDHNNNTPKKENFYDSSNEASQYFSHLQEPKDDEHVPPPPPPVAPPLELLNVSIAPLVPIPTGSNTASDAAVRARRMGHLRHHSALDIKTMPLNGIMRFLFRMYSTTETTSTFSISRSNLLRMLRDSNIYSPVFHWSHVTELFQKDTAPTATNPPPLDWLGYNQMVQRVAEMKYNSEEASSAMEKLQRRYLRPLAMAIGNKKRIAVPNKDYALMIDSMHTPMYYTTVNVHEDTLKTLFLRIQRDSKYNSGMKRGFVSLNALKDTLKECKLMPMHLTGGIVSNIAKSVKADRPQLMDPSTVPMMGSGLVGEVGEDQEEDRDIDSSVSFGFVEFMEFMSLVGFCVYGSLKSASSTSSSPTFSGKNKNSVLMAWNELHAEDLQDTLRTLLKKIDQSLEENETGYAPVPFAVVATPTRSHSPPPIKQQFELFARSTAPSSLQTREDMNAQMRADRVQDAFTKTGY